MNKISMTRSQGKGASEWFHRPTWSPLCQALLWSIFLQRGPPHLTQLQFFLCSKLQRLRSELHRDGILARAATLGQTESLWTVRRGGYSTCLLVLICGLGGIQNLLLPSRLAAGRSQCYHRAKEALLTCIFLLPVRLGLPDSEEHEIHTTPMPGQWRRVFCSTNLT